MSLWEVLLIKIPDFIKDDYIPELVENHPCYQESVYDSVMYDESPDGDLIQVDMTQILLNQEKYRRFPVTIISGAFFVARP